MDDRLSNRGGAAERDYGRSGDHHPVPATALAVILKGARHRPGWKLALETVEGVLKLVVLTAGFDGRHPERGPTYVTAHFFEVPPAHSDWVHWIFECIVQVEVHEAQEFFTINGRHPFAPQHYNPEENPNKSYKLPTTLAEFNEA